MRASTISSSGSEKRLKNRVSPPKRLLVTPNETLFPKNICSTPRCALSRQRCPDGCSGYGAVKSGVQDGSVGWIAFHGRQKSQWYLSFQQLIAVSAPARFSIPSRRAVSPIDRARFDEVRGDVVPEQGRPARALPEDCVVRLHRRADCAGRRAERLHLVEFRCKRGTTERVRAGGAELRGALQHERPHSADPWGRVEQREECVGSRSGC